MKRTMSIVAIAAAVAGCSTQAPEQQVSTLNVTVPPGYTGHAHTVVAGSRGSDDPKGAPGDTGAQGSGGMTGATSATRLSGPVGPEGQIGDMRAQGPALYGPTGPVGNRSATGMPVVLSKKKVKDPSVANAAGIKGAAGKQVSTVLADTPGPVVVVKQWTRYGYFTFDNDSTDIHASDRQKVSDITNYAGQNPALWIAIDDSTNLTSSNDGNDQNVGQRRAGAIRAALIGAGTPAHTIVTAAFADPQPKRKGEVQVLFRTSSIPNDRASAR